MRHVVPGIPAGAGLGTVVPPGATAPGLLATKRIFTGPFGFFTAARAGAAIGRRWGSDDVILCVMTGHCR